MTPEAEQFGPHRSIPMERVLAAYCRQRSMHFVVGDRTEPAIRLLMPEALLPVLAIQAEVNAHRLLGPAGAARGGRLFDEVFDRARESSGTCPPGKALPLGTRIHEDASALLGVFASVPALSADGCASLRGAMFVHALHEFFGCRSGTVEVSAVLSRHLAQAGSVLHYILQRAASSPSEPSWSVASAG